MGVVLRKQISSRSHFFFGGGTIIELSSCDGDVRKQDKRHHPSVALRSYQDRLLFRGKERSQLGRERGPDNEAEEHPTRADNVALQGVGLVSHLAHQQSPRDVSRHSHPLRNAT